MIKSWSYKDEYKELRKKILRSIDKSIKSGQILVFSQAHSAPARAAIAAPSAKLAAL